MYTEKTPSEIEHIRPIRPDDRYQVVYVQECKPKPSQHCVRDFLCAFLLGLAVFGFAAWTVFDRILSSLLLFL